MYLSTSSMATATGRRFRRASFGEGSDVKRTSHPNRKQLVSVEVGAQSILPSKYVEGWLWQKFRSQLKSNPHHKIEDLISYITQGCGRGSLIPLMFQCLWERTSDDIAMHGQGAGEATACCSPSRSSSSSSEPLYSAKWLAGSAAEKLNGRKYVSLLSSCHWTLFSGRSLVGGVGSQLWLAILNLSIQSNIAFSRRIHST